MTGTDKTGWATMLADLSIILFMITAADLANAELAQDGLASAEAVETAEPVAVYRPGRAAPPLSTWLAGQPDDPLQRLTIVVHYAGGDVDKAVAQGMTLSREAEQAGRPARMIVEQSEHTETAAILAYDSDAKAVARKLLSPEQPSSTENVR
jgi:hypothetical protein